MTGVPQALCNKLSGLLGDAHLRETMGLSASQYALDYAWEKIATQIIDVYLGLVKNKLNEFSKNIQPIIPASMSD